MSRSILKSFHRSGKKINESLNTSINNNTIYDEENISKIDRLNQTIKCESPIRDTCKTVEDSRQQKSFVERFLRFVSTDVKKKQLSSKTGEYKQNEPNSTVLKNQINVAVTKSNDIITEISQVYEKTVNKHGEVIEYAVPYIVQEKPEVQLPANNERNSGSFIRFEDVIGEDVLNGSKWNNHLEDVNHEQRRNVKITDLDESLDGSQLLDQSGEQIVGDRHALSELDPLEEWSQNITDSSLVQPLDKNVHIIECTPEEIQQNASVIRNSVRFGLNFSLGTFRKMPVALRQCLPRDAISIGLAEKAIERDLEILSNVKHSNMILLVAVCVNWNTVRHMMLLLEAADYTLNYFLHQMNMTLSVNESISVVQQIAGAALYLQESGYIHSNISSHNILVRKYPWCVKLSSFELTTEVDFAGTRIDILNKYSQKLPSLVYDCIDLPTAVEDENMSLKQQYQQMSRLIPTLKCTHDTPHEFLDMMSRHLMYDSNYRQHLSLHNFQAPELITTKLQFVFPTKKADIYSLCLLLWELLNKCVPYVVYSKLDMEKLNATRELSLPFFEISRCECFMDILRVGLAIDPEDRSINVEQLIAMLEDVKHQICFDLQNENWSGSEYFSEFSDEIEQDHEESLEDMHEFSYSPSRDFIRNNDESECSMDNTIISTNSLDFDRSVNEKELTSTREKRNKKNSAQKCYKKKFVCDICGRGYTMQSLLRRHQQSHMGKKPRTHFCNICPKSFIAKQTLQVHMLTHTGHKPHQCNDCSEAFYKSSQLKRHQMQQIHLKCKKFCCYATILAAR